MKPPTPEQFGVSEQHIDALKDQREQCERIVPRICGGLLLILSLGYALMVAIFDSKAKRGGIGIDVGMFFGAFVIALFFALPVGVILSHMLYEGMWIFERMSKWKRNVGQYERAVKNYKVYTENAKPQKGSKSGFVMTVIVGLCNPVLGAYFLWKWVKGGYECDLCKKRVPVSAYDVSRGRFGRRLRYSMDVICDECWFKANSR